MALFDLPLDELLGYAPRREEPGDFDTFWRTTLDEVAQVPLETRFEWVDVGLRALDTWDVTFAGFGGDPIKGWLLAPRGRTAALPCVVEYIGYGGGRGFPSDWLLWASAGFAHLVMDTRGQGSSWQNGDTPDPYAAGADPQVPGFMTRGILRPETYYYRRVFTDAVRAVAAARTHPAIDPTRVAVAGASQGGGIALAVAGLVPDLHAVMVDVPFLCHIRRATQLVDTQPYQEISRYCQTHRSSVETVFRTLAYFDGVNFATRAQAPALFSVGLMDDTCPPSTVFAAYNHYVGPRQIRVYEYNRHDGGGNYHTLEKLRFMQTAWQVSAP